MNWNILNDVKQLELIDQESLNKLVLILKHSTRCSISSMAKSRFENNWNTENKNVAIYYLDLIAYRNISNEIAEITGVEHQSPQAIVLKNKEVIYQATHSDIDAKSINEILTEV